MRIEKINRYMIGDAIRNSIAGYSNIEITTSPDYFINDIKNNSIYKNDESLKRKAPEWLHLWEQFKNYQDIIYASKNRFKPEFIGWKIEHSFRAKNSYNATVLNNYEFHFDKSLSRIINVKNIK